MNSSILGPSSLPVKNNTLGINLQQKLKLKISYCRKSMFFSGKTLKKLLNFKFA
jgi:hypothetical protein